MDFQQIKYAVDGRVAIITLYRPENLNAYTDIMSKELIEAFDIADKDDQVRVVIVTGSGDRAFCAGADLSGGGFGAEGRTRPATYKDHRDIASAVGYRIYQMKKPVIGAINGHAVGAGITITTPMDVRIVSEKAKIGFVFNRRGICPEGLSSWFLPRIVGISTAMEWFMTGRLFTAQEALEKGLVSRVVPPEKVMETAMEIAHECADNTSAISVALARQMVLHNAGADHPIAAFRAESYCVYYMATSPDCLEGAMSFIQKRPPEFTMKPSTDMPDFYPWWKERKFEDED
jgi:enoyl-CoA hydratase/carnithine racemase